MSNLLVHWWRRHKLKQALKQGDRLKAKILLQKNIREKRGLTWWESLFHNQLKQEKSYQALQDDRQLLLKREDTSFNKNYLTPDLAVVNQFFHKLQITQHDPYKRQVIGIDGAVFDELESQLVDYLQEEFSKPSSSKLKHQLRQALDDLNSLKQGRDPSYSMAWTPHVYFMKYFLENTYSLYLVWLFLYEEGLFSTEFNILDLAAGPATTAYGYAAFLQTLEKVIDVPQTHLSYFSLEQQKDFQYRGLQFWRRYIEAQNHPINVYFRFVTEDICSHPNWLPKVPPKFFDIVFISHCFSSEQQTKRQFSTAYQEIIKLTLKQDGFVVLIIQNKKLFRMYDSFPSEDVNEEKRVILHFVEELGLTLLSYQYLTSTSFRKPIKGKEFREFANQNLPEQTWMNRLLEEHLDQKFCTNFTLDDYVVVAKQP